MALMKQLALGRDVLAPIISVVIVSTVVTPTENGKQRTGGNVAELSVITSPGKWLYRTLGASVSSIHAFQPSPFWFNF